MCFLPKAQQVLDLVPGSACCRDPCSAPAWGDANLLLLIAATLLQLSLWWVFASAQPMLFLFSLRGLIYFSHKKEAVVHITDPPEMKATAAHRWIFAFLFSIEVYVQRYIHTQMSSPSMYTSVSVCIHVYIHIHIHTYMQGGWNEMIFKAPSNPHHSMTVSTDRFIFTPGG